MQLIGNFMSELQNLSLEQLRHLVSIKEQIENLEEQLSAIIANGSSVAAPPAEESQTGRSRKISASGRAKIAAAAKARWARIRAEKGQPQIVTAAPKKKRKMNAAARAKMARGTRTLGRGKSGRQKQSLVCAGVCSGPIRKFDSKSPTHRGQAFITMRVRRGCFKRAAPCRLFT